MAETDREPPHGKYVDAQKTTAHDPVLASVVIVIEKRMCQIRVGMPCRTFAKSVDLRRHTVQGTGDRDEENSFLPAPGL